jgi:hypothetical protein
LNKTHISLNMIDSGLIIGTILAAVLGLGVALLYLLTLQGIIPTPSTYLPTSATPRDKMLAALANSLPESFEYVSSQQFDGSGNVMNATFSSGSWGVYNKIDVETFTDTNSNTWATPDSIVAAWQMEGDTRFIVLMWSEEFDDLLEFAPVWRSGVRPVQTLSPVKSWDIRKYDGVWGNPELTNTVEMIFA